MHILEHARTKIRSDMIFSLFHLYKKKKEVCANASITVFRSQMYVQ